MDIKAGVSGAGREATEETHYVSAVDNLNAYKIDGHRHSAEMEQELPGARFSFLTHLMPVDQGIFASLLRDARGAALARGGARALRGALRGRAVHRPARRARRARRTCATRTAPQVHVTVVGERVIALAAIDNLWKGAAGQGVQDLNLMLGRARDGGPRMSFFSSRWVDLPVNAGEAKDTELPAGFRAAGVAAGIKPDGLDVGVLVSDAPETVSAARFTTNARAGRAR